MLSDWLFQHGGALQLLPWSLGIVLGLHQIVRRAARPWLTVSVLAALSVLGVLALDPHAVPTSLGLFELRRVEVSVQWAAAAALILAGAQRHGADRRSWSLLPVITVGWIGPGTPQPRRHRRLSAGALVVG
ncbi:MAG: hypothetical protein ACI8S6_000674 [Myxococcota bacterium]|jgi:hypothetical protein